jgi:hypothetical protein
LIDILDNLYCIKQGSANGVHSVDAIKILFVALGFSLILILILDTYAKEGTRIEGI